MDNTQIARLLGQIADLQEIKGGNEYEIRAYRRAAEAILAQPADLTELHRQARLREISGIGARLEATISEIISTGTCQMLEQLSQEIPGGVLEFLRIPGVGPKTAARLYHGLQVTTLGQLEAAAMNRRVQELPGLGVKTEENILSGLKGLKARGERVPLRTGLESARWVVEYLRRGPGVDRVEVAGSLRRRQETIGDIDLVVSTRDAAAVTEALEQMPGVQVTAVLTKGFIRLAGPGGIPVDIYVVQPEEFTAALRYYTGSAAHNRKLAELAATAGYGCSRPEFIVSPDGQRLPCQQESDVYRWLGLPAIVPELREDRGEIAAALTGSLPDLVNQGDIRGDLHVHTTWR